VAKFWNPTGGRVARCPFRYRTGRSVRAFLRLAPAPPGAVSCALATPRWLPWIRLAGGSRPRLGAASRPAAVL